MSKYRLLSLFWIIPAYLGFLTAQQTMVHFGSKKTMDTGESYAAKVLDTQVKHMAAQSNGYVIISFTPENGQEITRKLSLTMQMVEKVIENKIIPIRYREGGYPDIVMIPVYEIQYATSTFNMGVAALSFIFSVIAALLIQRYSNTRSRLGDEKLDYERID